MNFMQKVDSCVDAQQQQLLISQSPRYLFILYYFIIQVVREVQKENTTIIQKPNTQNYKWKNVVPSYDVHT